MLSLYTGNLVAEQTSYIPLSQINYTHQDCIKYNRPINHVFSSLLIVAMHCLAFKMKHSVPSVKNPSSDSFKRTSNHFFGSLDTGPYVARRGHTRALPGLPSKLPGLPARHADRQIFLCISDRPVARHGHTRVLPGLT
jgi:hypothetical protein